MGVHVTLTLNFGLNPQTTALPTVTEENAIAAPAISGLSRRPEEREQTPIATGNTQHVVNKAPEQVLIDIRHRGAADPNRSGSRL